MAPPTLIYCGGGNARFAEIAIAAGFRYGACLPASKPYAQIYFADQNWKKPNRAAYNTSLAVHRPHMASVLDWEREDQFCEVMGWAEDAAVFVRQVVIIPKIPDTVHRIPLRIGAAEVVIGYSVPTTHGGTCVPIWELEGRKVHLLGGSPQRQMREWEAMRAFCEVVSADGNMAQKMAVRHVRFWVPKTLSVGNQWPTLREANGGEKWGEDAPDEAFRRSCHNIANAWRQLA